MPTEDERALSTSRKRRGVAKASITRLDSRVAELESRAELTADDGLTAQHLSQRLNALGAEFKSHHLAVVDLIDEEALEGEQAILDENDDRISNPTIRVQRLVSSTPSTTSPLSTRLDPSQCLSKRLSHLDKELLIIVCAVESIGPESEIDSCLLKQYEEQLSGLKTELTSISRDILSLAVDDDSLSVEQGRLSPILFDTRLKIKRLLQDKTKLSPFTSDKTGVKLPKLTVPAFDGNILNWHSFWEQFVVSVHDRTNLSPSEKLTYLRHAVKDGSTKHVVAGLTGSGDKYDEAVDCLCKRYDRPRLLHQAHVRAIIDSPSLKDGTGRELRRLHDTLNQHLRALKAMKYNPPGPFITSMVELKLDPGTMFEWQKHTQTSSAVPHFDALLEFIDLRAQASESTAPELSRKRPYEVVSSKRSFTPRSVASLTASLNDSCTVCKTGKHPAYSCPKFKSLPHDQMMGVLKSKSLCLNCLKPGHFVKECTSTNRCRKCQKLHHTLLHVDSPPEHHDFTDVTPATLPSSSTIPAHTHVAHANSKSHQFLLMTCRVLILSPEGVTHYPSESLVGFSFIDFLHL